MATTTLALSAIRSEVGTQSANIFWTTNIGADGKVWYASSSPVLSQSNLLSVYDGVTKTSHMTTLPNLLPNTDYYYRIVSKGINGQTATSGEYHFRTGVQDNVAPFVYGVSVLGVNASTTITFFTNESATSTVWYSATADVLSDVNKKSVSSNTQTMTHSLQLTDLKPNTIYRFVIVVTDGSGNTTTSTSNLYTFTTSVFSLSGLNALVGSGSASINWMTNWVSDTKVWYATSTPVMSAINRAFAYNANMVAIHNLNLSGLATGTTYYYVGVSKDAEGMTATSSEQSFLTLP
jgi:Purple acid Phosphatase, N-terminal domain